MILFFIIPKSFPIMKRVQINLEFIFRASPTILYRFLTSPSTLIRWFCDEVDITADVYTFVWEGSEEEYLEFRMRKSPVTGETVLEITDYCDEDETNDTRQLWEAQMKQLKQETGG